MANFFAKKRTPANEKSYKIQIEIASPLRGSQWQRLFSYEWEKNSANDIADSVKKDKKNCKKKELPQTGDPIKSRLRLLHPYGVRNDNAFSVTSEKKESRFPSRFLKFNFFLEASETKNSANDVAESLKSGIFSVASETRNEARSRTKRTASGFVTPYREANGKITCPWGQRRPEEPYLPAVREKRHHP